MTKPMIKSVMAFIVLGLSLPVAAQGPQGDLSPDSGGYTEMKDQLRQSTYASHLRNSKFDQWKYISELKAEFQKSVAAVQQHQALVKQVKDYCASDTDSYTCKKEKLVVSVDERLDSAAKDWQNAINVIVDIEKLREGIPDEAARSKELQKVNVMMNDIDRFNERAKKQYNLAAKEIVEFQKQNPKLFTSSKN